MKKFLLALMLLGITFLAFAQERAKGDLQVGAFGGATLPLGTYKQIGEAKLGYHGGLFVDKYFTGNKFGLGVDARYVYNSISTHDSLTFENGFIGTDYRNSARFQNFLFTLGPTYKYAVEKFHVEAYLRGGVMMQYFPEHVTTISYEDVVGWTHWDSKWTDNDASNKANSWAGLAGLRVSYLLSPKVAVFAHGDYVQTFGEKFGGKASQFAVQSSQESTPIDETTAVKSVFDHYSDVFDRKTTPRKSVQAGIGLKVLFGAPVKVVETAVAPYYDNMVQAVGQKNLQIVVKDKQTNLALSGVTVTVDGPGIQETSMSDADGQASKLMNVQPGQYIVVGEKNGIKTPALTVTEDDFKGSSETIFKVIYHDDPRFTLVGETFDCNTQRNISGINTILTHSGSKVSTNQTSDVEGKFIYQLEPQSEFTVVANQQGKYSQTELVSTKGLDRSQTLYVTLKLGVCDLVKDSSWELKNILYDFDKSDIRPDAAIILDNVVAIMQQNASLRIELSSHTDSRGNDDYNLRLSQRRADAAVDYLVRNGISRSRLVAKGYGETRLKNQCGNGVDCSEAQHQENRRTEITVLDY